MAEICYNCFHEKDAPGACPYCQYDGAADKGRFPAALPAGMTLAEHYTVGRVLGQGGFGITYIAKNEKNGKLVAIKEYFPDSMASRTSDHSVSAHSGERGESFRYGLGCFLEEAKTLAAFIGNPNIVRVYRYFEENGTAYFVMEYVEGVSLKDYLKRRGGKISFAEAKRILIPAMDALAAVHSKGIVHRDISPDNILIKKDGTVKLLDFGAARYSIGDMSRSLDVVLKHGYAPREQYTRRGRQGPFTDIYSLAATFYRALTGVVPQESIDRLDNDELITPMAYCPDLTPQADFALYHALSVQPADRFQSMAQFKNALLSQTPMNQDTLFKKMPNGSYVNAYASAAASARAAVPYQNTAPSYQNAPYAAQPAKPAAYAAPPQKPAQYQAPAQNPAPYQAPAQNYYQQPAAPAASPYAAPQTEAKKPFSPIKIMLISFGASAVVMGIVALIVALAT